MNVYRAHGLGGSATLVGHCLPLSPLPGRQTYHVLVVGGQDPHDPFVRTRYALREVPDEDLVRPMLSVVLLPGQDPSALPGWKRVPIS